MPSFFDYIDIKMKLNQKIDNLEHLDIYGFLCKALSRKVHEKLEKNS